MSQTFIKKTEDFTCEHCGNAMRGDGYTNHCSNCLFSKHVDVFPGDRAEACGGMMEPRTVLKRGETYIITHQCLRCGEEQSVRVRDDDNFEALLLLC